MLHTTIEQLTCCGWQDPEHYGHFHCEGVISYTISVEFEQPTSQQGQLC